MWDPAQYGRYADERRRPFHELVGDGSARSGPASSSTWAAATAR